MRRLAPQVGIIVRRRGLVDTVMSATRRRRLPGLARVVMHVVRRVVRGGRLATQVGSSVLAMLSRLVMSVVRSRTLAGLAMLTRVVMTVIRRRRRSMLARPVMSVVRTRRPAGNVCRPVGYRNGNGCGTCAAALRAVLSRDLEAWRRVVGVAC
jgi:hypothetical protein